jgi:cytochrome c oxidase subunit I
VILLISAALFIYNLVAMHRQPARKASSLQRYAQSLHTPASIPASLNGFRLWNVLVLVLMILAYGYPIAQFFLNPAPAAVVHRVD